MAVFSGNVCRKPQSSMYDFNDAYALLISRGPFSWRKTLSLLYTFDIINNCLWTRHISTLTWICQALSYGNTSFSEIWLLFEFINKLTMKNEVLPCGNAGQLRIYIISIERPFAQRVCLITKNDEIRGFWKQQQPSHCAFA